VTHVVTLTARSEETAKQYINTISYGWLESIAPRMRLSDVSTQARHLTRPKISRLFAKPRFVRQSLCMASQRKPVIVRKFSRDWYAGYAAAGFGQETPELEILDLGGKVLRIGWEQVKWVCYVRDFPAPSSTADNTNPERLMHKRFSTRPRTAGVWLRMTLTDGDELEGLAANDRSLVEGPGLLLTPPDTRSNTQRIYVPRAAIQTLQVAGLIGAVARKGVVQHHPPSDQPDLFPTDADTGMQ